MRKNNTEFQKKKNVILFIYGYACQICGLVSTQNHVHHVDKNHSNNDAYNLIPLCNTCHKQVHKNFYFAPEQYDTLILFQLDKLNSSF